MVFSSCFVYRFAFDFNPALQPRSLVVLGCICKEANDRLIRGVLEVLIMVGICVVPVLVKWPGLIFVNTIRENGSSHGCGCFYTSFKTHLKCEWIVFLGTEYIQWSRINRSFLNVPLKTSSHTQQGKWSIHRLLMALYSQVYDGENVTKNYKKWRILYSISNNVSATGTPTPLAI